MNEQKKDAPHGYDAEWQEALRQGAPVLSVVRTQVACVFNGLQDDKFVAGANLEMRDFRGQWLIRHRPPHPDAKWTVYKIGAGNQGQAQ